MKIKILIIIFVIVSLLSGVYVWNINRTELHLRRVPFNQLPGWDDTDTTNSLKAFNISCRFFLKQKPDTPVGSSCLALSAQDWYPACRAALLVDPTSSKQAKTFFEHWFLPVQFFNNKPVQGLFTGYYVAQLHGSLTKTTHYNVPVYRTPDNLLTIDLRLFDLALTNHQLIGRLEGSRIVPFYTRNEIDRGAISKSASVIVWVDNPVDRLFMEIQGSGIVRLDDGSHLFLGYSAQNGMHYTPIAHFLIQKGIMTKENQSMQGVREYLKSHPEERDSLISKNESFVFFKTQRQDSAIGVNDIPLTPGYSLAIDRQWIPIGIPIWLKTVKPDHQSNAKTVFQRLMIAQDTGGAIRGIVRGDVFFGAGKKAAAIAGKMNYTGYYWLFLPKKGHGSKTTILVNTSFIKTHDIII